MSQEFNAGDYLVFQLESGYGMLRILAVSDDGSSWIWHLCVYEELFPDIESAEQALARPELLHLSKPHIVLTDRAFERTPAAKLGHRAIDENETATIASWQRDDDQTPSDRSLLLLLGMR
jgi:hypothetical protein